MSETNHSIIRDKFGLEYVMCPNGKLAVKSYSPDTIIEELTIPRRVKISPTERVEVFAIGHRAFYKAKGLRKINLSWSITLIEDEAFAYATDLKEVDMERCIDLEGIPDYCFYGCTSLESIVFRERVKLVGTGAFGKCTNLVTIGTFRDADFINKVSWTDSEYDSPFDAAVLLAAGALEGCSSLIDLDGNFYIWGIDCEDVFHGCKSLKEVRLYLAEDDNEVCLPPRIFEGCESLEHVSLYSINDMDDSQGIDTQLEIMSDAFKGCKSLKTIDGAFGNINIEAVTQ